MTRQLLKTFMTLGVFALSLNLMACATASTKQTGTRVLDPDADDGLGGTGTESSDIRTIGERMAREILGIAWPDSGETPRIAVLPIVNQTRFRVDPKLLQNKLLKSLVTHAKGKLTFLARDSEQAIIQEREKKRSGMYDQGENAPAMFGADYFLKGEMRSLSKSNTSEVSDYIVYSFQLINTETGAILWMGDYETKKAGDTGVVYQ
ncbi:MAG: hypothetical protein CMH56_10465 [Myxococcales bacterium]|nr:hypothetical protein [Myxococcales bacterium]|tara:strand:+ start:706 stop:1323 length:618 start_codon:yes stop_codon:yes gene_type:complete